MFGRNKQSKNIESSPRLIKTASSEVTDILGESIDLVLLPTNALDAFGGKEGFSSFLDFVLEAVNHDEPEIAAFVVEGANLYPNSGLPSIFIAGDNKSAYYGGQQLLMSAMMSGHADIAFGNIHEGRAAMPYLRDLLTKATTILADSIDTNDIVRTQLIIGNEV